MRIPKLALTVAVLLSLGFVAIHMPACCLPGQELRGPYTVTNTTGEPKTVVEVLFSGTGGNLGKVIASKVPPGVTVASAVTGPGRNTVIITFEGRGMPAGGEVTFSVCFPKGDGLPDILQEAPEWR